MSVTKIIKHCNQNKQRLMENSIRTQRTKASRHIDTKCQAPQVSDGNRDSWKLAMNVSFWKIIGLYFAKFLKLFMRLHLKRAG